MLQNLTLTIDEDVLRSARKVALERNTSVNQMVRDYLAEVTSQQDRRRQAHAGLREMFRKSRVKLDKITWTRDELYER